MRCHLHQAKDIRSDLLNFLRRVHNVFAHPALLQMTESIWHYVNWLATAVSDYKMLFERSLGFSDDVVHVFVGVFLQLSFAALLRISIASWRPIGIIIIFELFNELIDLSRDVWPSPSMQLGESCKDVILTLALPVLLRFLARLRPQLFLGKATGYTDENVAADESGAPAPMEVADAPRAEAGG